MGGTLGIMASSPATLDLGVARARVTRVPIDLSLRALWRRGRFELAGDLGVAATVHVVQGIGLAMASPKTTVELGMRSAAQLNVWANARFAPFVAIDASIAPRPGTLSVDPVGKVGQLPWLWLGAMLGATARLD